MVKGFNQRKEIDYFDTYAPVSEIATIRVLSALVSIHGLIVHQMDMKTPFMNGDLDEKIYMEQHKGFVVPGQEHKVCKLIKSLYGLKQEPKEWYEKCDSTITTYDFKANE